MRIVEQVIYESLDYVHIMLDSVDDGLFPSRLEKDHKMYPTSFHLVVYLDEHI